MKAAFSERSTFTSQPSSLAGGLGAASMQPGAAAGDADDESAAGALEAVVVRAAGGAEATLRVSSARALARAGGVLRGGPAGGAADATGQLVWAGAHALAAAVLAPGGPAARALRRGDSERGASAGAGDGSPRADARDVSVDDGGEGGGVVVELGAGTALVSAVAATALQGARAVIATDGAPSALARAAETLAAVSPAAPGARTGVALLAWPLVGADVIAATAGVAGVRAAAAAAAGAGDGRASLVLAAECIYPSSSTGAICGLLWAAEALLSPGRSGASIGPSTRRRGVLLIAYTPRSPRTSVALFAALAARAWRARVVDWREYAVEPPPLGAVVLCGSPPAGEREAEGGRDGGALDGGASAFDAAVEEAEALTRAVVAAAVAGEVGALGADEARVAEAVSAALEDALPALRRAALAAEEAEAEAADPASWAPPIDDDLAVGGSG